MRRASFCPACHRSARVQRQVNRQPVNRRIFSFLTLLRHLAWQFMSKSSHRAQQALPTLVVVGQSWAYPVTLVFQSSRCDRVDSCSSPCVTSQENNSEPSLVFPVLFPSCLLGSRCTLNVVDFNIYISLPKYDARCIKVFYRLGAPIALLTFFLASSNLRTTSSHFVVSQMFFDFCLTSSEKIVSPVARSTTSTVHALA